MTVHAMIQGVRSDPAAVAGWPQRWQNRAPGLSGAAQVRHPVLTGVAVVVMGRGI
ncbi:MAG TPA: hypothetical protein VNJ71_04840 [Gemmatimonadales bacterium]|nr:hypothetical protein [Gemmatimonadales bacterium]